MTTYNEKRFLLPDSISSCAHYHIKVYDSGDYRIRIHDCNAGIRLRGSLSTPVGLDEAMKKASVLAQGLTAFIRFLERLKGDR
jgi:hypothetical protein